MFSSFFSHLLQEIKIIGDFFLKWRVGFRKQDKIYTLFIQPCNICPRRICKLFLYPTNAWLVTYRVNAPVVAMELSFILHTFGSIKELKCSIWLHFIDTYLHQLCCTVCCRNVRKHSTLEKLSLSPLQFMTKMLKTVYCSLRPWMSSCTQRPRPVTNHPQNSLQISGIQTQQCHFFYVFIKGLFC